MNISGIIWAKSAPLGKLGSLRIACPWWNFIANPRFFWINWKKAVRAFWGWFWGAFRNWFGKFDYGQAILNMLPWRNNAKRFCAQRFLKFRVRRYHIRLVQIPWTMVLIVTQNIRGNFCGHASGIIICKSELTWADEEQDHHACSQVSWFHLE